MKKTTLTSLLFVFISLNFPLIAQAAQLSPTIYYIKTIDLDQECAVKKTIVGVDGKTMFKVCRDAYKKCVIEGTCAILKPDTGEEEPIEMNVESSDTTEATSDATTATVTTNEPEFEVINYVKQTSNGTPLFMAVDEATCPWGYGVSNICLDPYFTVAADLTFHRPGDVIFVNKLKGLKLPNGETHTGFMIVRDRGGAIKGADRFDFYTGLLDYRDQKNPFTPIGFATSTNKIEYRKATAAETIAVRAQRNFPKLPK